MGPKEKLLWNFHTQCVALDSAAQLLDHCMASGADDSVKSSARYLRDLHAPEVDGLCCRICEVMNEDAVARHLLYRGEKDVQMTADECRSLQPFTQMIKRAAATARVGCYWPQWLELADLMVHVMDGRARNRFEWAWASPQRSVWKVTVSSAASGAQRQ